MWPVYLLLFIVFGFQQAYAGICEDIIPSSKEENLEMGQAAQTILIEIPKGLAGNTKDFCYQIKGGKNNIIDLFNAKSAGEAAMGPLNGTAIVIETAYGSAREVVELGGSLAVGTVKGIGHAFQDGDEYALAAARKKLAECMLKNAGGGGWDKLFYTSCATGGLVTVVPGIALDVVGNAAEMTANRVDILLTKNILGAGENILRMGTAVISLQPEKFWESAGHAFFKLISIPVNALTGEEMKPNPPMSREEWEKYQQEMNEERARNGGF